MRGPGRWPEVVQLWEREQKEENVQRLSAPRHGGEGHWSYRGWQVCSVAGLRDELLCVWKGWAPEYRVVGSTKCLYAETDLDKAAFWKDHSGSEMETRLEVGKSRGRETTQKSLWTVMAWTGEGGSRRQWGGQTWEVLGKEKVIDVDWIQEWRRGIKNEA